MNRSLSYLLSLAIATVFLGCRQVDNRKVTFNLPQVINNACEQRVRQAIKDLKGIDQESIVFDYDNGTMVLVYDSMKLANKNIEHNIIAAGFDANELKADPKARAALPPECLPTATNTAPTTTTDAP